MVFCMCSVVCRGVTILGCWCLCLCAFLLFRSVAVSTTRTKRPLSTTSKQNTQTKHTKKGILLTPFHAMALIAPSTTAADVDYHTAVFKECVELLVGARDGGAPLARL